MPICDVPGVGLACKGLSDAASSVTGDVIDSASKSFAEGVAKLAKALLTFWVKVPFPDLEDAHGPVAFIRDSTTWITGFVLIVSLMIAGAKMAITHKAEAGVTAASGVWQMLLYAGAGVPAIALLGGFGDEFSKWILDRAADGDFGTRLAEIFTVAGLGPLGAGVVLIVSLIAIISALAQILLMIVRVGMLILLAGMLPLSASAAVSSGGKSWFGKNLAWLLAFLAFKPAAAIIYAAAFAIVGKGKDVTTVLSGLFLITLAVVALPALMRLAAPATAAIAGGAAGAGMGAGMMVAGGSLATGAMQVRGGGPGAAMGGGPRGQSPSGSSGPESQGSGRAKAQGGKPTATGAGKPSPSTGGGTAGGAGADVAQGAAGGSKAGGPYGAAAGAAVGAVKNGVQAAKGVADRAAGPDGADPEAQR